MKKINTILKVAFALSFFLFAGQAKAAGPSQDDLAGTYKLTADVNVSTSCPDDIKDIFADSFEFRIRPAWSEDNLYSNYVSDFITTADLQFSYTQSSGAMEVQNFFLTPAVLGFAVNDTFVGRKTGSGSNFIFTVAEDGTITIPDFKVVTFNASTDAITATYATYTNVVVTVAGEEEDPDNDGYPALSEILGKYTYNGTVDIKNPTYTDSFPASFEFEIANGQINSFFGNSDFNPTFTYDDTTGIIKITANNTNKLGGSGYVGFVNADETWAGMGALYSNFYWQVGKDGSITIPAFNVITFTGKVQDSIVAEYGAYKIGGEGDEEGEDGYVASNPELTSYDIVNEFTWTIRPTDISFSTTGETVDITVQLVQQDSAYYLIEKGETNYFNGNYIPLSINGENVTFKGFQSGSLDGQPVFFEIFNGGISDYLAYYRGGEFVFPGSPVFCWFVSKTASEFEPTDNMDFVTMFYVVKSEAVKSLPKAGDFDGWYKYTPGTYKLINQNFAEYLPEEPVFEITTTNGNIAIKGFFFESTNCDYDETTGVLTLNTLYYRPDGSTYVGIAPVEGGWKGMAALTGNKMKFQIGIDGSITIPDFDMGTFSGSNFTTYAEYRNGVVTGTEAPGEEEDPTADYSNFVGSYVFTGTQTNYSIADAPIETEDSQEEDFILRFTINEFGQISEFNGKSLPENFIGANYMYNKGELSNDNTVYTLTMQMSNGVEWYYGDSESGEGAYSILFGDGTRTGSDVFDQDDVAFTLTKNEDGTFDVTDISWVLRFNQTVENSDGTTSSVRTFSTITTWTGLEYFVEQPEPDFTGIESIIGTWQIPMTDYLEVLTNPVFDYEVSLDGTTVTFTEIVEGKEGDYTLVGEFVNNTTIRFDKAVVGDTSSSYPIRMIPFINTDNVKLQDGDTSALFNELNGMYTPITATYDAAAGTLTFTENSGVLYGHLDDSWAPSGSSFNPKGYWDAAFGFNGEGKRTGEILPAMTISGLVPTVSGNNVTVTMNVAAENFEISEGATWKATVTEVAGDQVVDTKSVDATYADGVATIELTDVTTGTHIYSVTLTYTLDTVNVTSNSKDFTAEVGAYFTLTNIVASANEDNTWVNITFDVDAYNLPEDEITYMLTLTPVATEEVSLFAADGQTITTPATVEYTQTIGSLQKGSGVAQITNLSQGSHSFLVELSALDSTESVIASTGNAVTPSVEFTLEETVGVSGVVVDENAPVRYFNLQGVEVSNPENGTIVIKVQGTKAEKIVF